jgi:hypothetical protein
MSELVTCIDAKRAQGAAIGLGCMGLPRPTQWPTIESYSRDVGTDGPGG